MEYVIDLLAQAQDKLHHHLKALDRKVGDIHEAKDDLETARGQFTDHIYQMLQGFCMHHLTSVLGRQKDTKDKLTQVEGLLASLVKQQGIDTGSQTKYTRGEGERDRNR